MGQAAYKYRDVDCLASNLLSAVGTNRLPHRQTAYRQNGKSDVNSKPRIGDFFAANDAVYDQKTPSNCLTPLEKTEPFWLFSALVSELMHLNSA